MGSENFEKNKKPCLCFQNEGDNLLAQKGQITFLQAFSFMIYHPKHHVCTYIIIKSIKRIEKLRTMGNF